MQYYVLADFMSDVSKLRIQRFSKVWGLPKSHTTDDITSVLQDISVLTDINEK